jgi:hypothetical protein
MLPVVPVLYIPFLLPFVAASLVTLLVHRKDLEVHWTVPIREAFQRIAGEAGSSASPGSVTDPPRHK